MDAIDKRTRGLLAIAITDAVHANELRPVSPTLLGFLGLVGTRLPVRRAAVNFGIVGFVAVFGLPWLLAVEALRRRRAQRFTRAAERVVEASTVPAGGVYRAGSSTREGAGAGLLGSDKLYAIDWSIWRDGVLVFAGAALGVVRGETRFVHWLSVHRGYPPPGAVDGLRLVGALRDLRPQLTRWEWQIEDPFEAVEREQPLLA
ncbi:MAG: hypothetical protein U0414_27030 [Polyangiaceae bacterium]